MSRQNELPLTPVQRRLLDKLPASATGGQLNRAERLQLRTLELRGLIRYIDQSGLWVDVNAERAFARHRARDPHCTCSSCIEWEDGRAGR